MIHPDKIGAEAKKKEDENFKFRSYLKGYADEEELLHFQHLVQSKMFIYSWKYHESG